MNKKLKLLTDRDRLKEVQKDKEVIQQNLDKMARDNHLLLQEARKSSTELAQLTGKIARLETDNALFLDLLAYLMKPLREKF